MSKITSNGFTLIEVIIATSLLAFIMLGVITISNNSLETKDIIIKEDREKLQIQTAIDRITWDFSHIYSPLYFSKKYTKAKPIEGEQEETEDDVTINSNYSSNDRFSFANTSGLPVPKILIPDNTTLEFFTTSNRNYQMNKLQSKYGWVRYSLEQMELTDEEKSNELGDQKLVRTFSAENPFSSEKDLLDEKKSYEILSHIQKLKIEYWDQKNKKFIDSMIGLDERAKHLFRGIRITFTWKGLPGNDPLTVTKIFRPLWPYFEDKKTKDKSFYDMEEDIEDESEEESEDDN